MSLLPLNGALGAPIEFNLGERYSALNRSNSLHKRERQTNHSFNASITKSRSSWTHKAGVEYRVYLSNYIDPEESFWIQTSQDYTRPIVTISGGAAGPAVDASNDGFALASFLLGAGNISVAEGRSVPLALAQKYFAMYTQNDWRVNSRLTVNLGARWDLQPGPTERYDRMSAVDFTATNPFGTKGAIVFPGVNGVSRNLYKTRYKELAPRTGFAWRVQDDFVVRGGYGITFLPSNTGYFDGTYNYGSATFSQFTISQPYGLTPAGVPVGKFYDVNSISGGQNAQLDAPSAYGGGTPRFDYQGYRSGSIQQYNFFLQKRFGNDWTLSAGYTGTMGKHLQLTNVAANQTQSVDPNLLAQWRNEFAVTRNNPASLQVLNPFQPDVRNLIPFKGNLGRTTLSQLEVAYPYPHLGALGAKRAFGFSSYNAMVLQADRRFSRGLFLGMHYTWSKALEVQQSDAQSNQGYNQTGDAPNLDLNNLDNSRRLSLADTPHRFVVNFTYELPFRSNGAFNTGKGLLNTLLGGWRTGGNFQASSGVPLHITGGSSNSLNARPDRVPGVPVQVAKEFQRWYDGNTTIALPSGRQYRPPAYTFLKYNPDAFTGRVIEYTAASGNPAWISDLYWYGNAAQTYNDIRTDSRWNLNLSLQKTFAVTEKLKIDLSAQASNALNHTQWRPGGFARGLGGQAISTVNGQIPGYGTSTNFGTHNLSTMEPRTIQLMMRMRF